jgi:capsular exopolysaccharide synthesis family protein
MVTKPQIIETAPDGDPPPFDWAERLHYYWFVARQLLRRYWWVLLLTTSIGVAYQGWKTINSKSTFVSNAKLMLSGFVASPVGSGGIQEQFGFWFGNQREILESPGVRRSAMARVRAFRPDLDTGYVSIQTRHIPETAVIEVLARGDVREFTQAYLNALIDEYMNVRQQMKGETSERALLAITERLDQLEQQISQQEDAVVEFRKENNLIFIQQQGDAAGSNLARLKDRRAEIRTQIRLLETLGIDIQMQAPEMLGLQTSLLDTDAERDYRETRRVLDRLRAEMKEFSIYLKDRHPKIINLNTEIRRTDNLLGIYRLQAIEQVNERKGQLVAQLANLDIVIAEQEAVALGNSRLSAEFERLNANLTRSRNLYENLLRSIQNLETGRQIDPEIVNILEPASVPSEIRAQLSQKVGEGFFGGLLVGIGLLVTIGFLDARILSADDLKRRFETPLLGLVPMEQLADGRVELLHAKDRRHLFAEACRALRSSLFFMGEGEDRPKVVLVSSSVPGEGKSTIAANLAIAISLTAARTLLIDSDLRRGQLSRDLGLAAKPGLSDLLQGRTGLDEIIQHAAYENLDFIATGEYPDRPGELLLSGAMDKLIRDLRERYDFIILDSAPILATDDTTGFAIKADSVLFVIRSAFTQARQIKSAVDRLRLRGIELAGFVLNCVDTKGIDYYYHKKYSDYYSYHPR